MQADSLLPSHLGSLLYIYKGGAQEGQSQRGGDVTMDTEVGVMLGCKPRNVGSFLKARKPKEIDSSLDQ